MHEYESKNHNAMIITNSLQDKFYTSIAAYYSEIFPFNPSQVSLMEQMMGPLHGKTILDVGCASGELAFQLAQLDAKVTAIDLNKSLLADAREKRYHENVTYLWANMLHIARLFGRSKFDGVVCLGNTLVHLMNPMQMRDFFSGVLTVLKPGGKFMLQILNYDKIFAERPATLPLIDTPSVMFERHYIYEEGTREIDFKTRLTLKQSGEVIDNQTELLGIGSADLTLLMDVAGLKDIQLFGGFDGSPFSKDKLPLIFTASKIDKHEFR
jgi:2-polyprenyl-3-methyl-5-hydroxy-6-metoxy-1,4-benzoquinol methylase